MSAWEKTLDKYGLMIEERLSSFLEKETKRATDYHDFIGRLHGDLHEYIARRGKRLASCSTLLAYKGFNTEVDDRILGICVGMELYRHSILVHDDLVDRDESRRGGSTIHKKYSQEHDARFGDGLAVFAGNMLYVLALKALYSSGFEPSKIVQVLNMLNDAFHAVNESQVLDLLFEYKRPDMDEWYIMASKRAALLFKASLLIGAALADASEEDLRLLKEAGEHIGYCFDIQDDIIDTFASEEQYRRRPGGDLSRRKKPLHIVYTYLMARQEQLETIRTKADMITLEDLNRIRKVISECGALEAAKSRSREHADAAKKLISKTNMSQETKGFFVSFIDYVKESLNWYT